MNIRFSHEGRPFRVTTEHSASSYGQPVLIVDGELTDDYRIQLSDHGAGRRSCQVFDHTGQLLCDLNVPQRTLADYDPRDDLADVDELMGQEIVE